MTTKEPKNPSILPDNAPSIHESTTTVVQQDHEYSAPDMDDDESLDKAIQRRRFNKDLDANELGLSKQDWKHRRRMAWVALFAIIGMNLCLFLMTDTVKIDKIGVALTWLDAALAGVVMSYVGFSSWKEIKGK